MRKIRQTVLGLILIALGAAVFAAHGPLTARLVEFSERVLSTDGKLKAVSGQLSFYVHFLAVFLAACGFLALHFIKEARAAAFFGRLRAWFDDPLSGRDKKKWFIGLTLIPAAAAAVLFFLYLGRVRLGLLEFYTEDDLFEYFTVLFLFLAAFLMVKSALGIRKVSRGIPGLRLKAVIRLQILAAALLIFFAVEELSWGQRIYGLATPESVTDWNIELELNIHNMFDPGFPMIEWIGAVILFLAVAGFGLARFSRKWGWKLELILPHGSLILVNIFMIVMREDELIEELLALFAFVYALRLVRGRCAEYIRQKASEAES